VGGAFPMSGRGTVITCPVEPARPRGNHKSAPAVSDRWPVRAATGVGPIEMPSEETAPLD
jgi:hypothetical protein